MVARVLDMKEIEVELRWFKTHWMHCIVSLSKTLYPLLSTDFNPERQEVVPA